MRQRLFAGICLALAACFAALGVWQIERRAWKLDLIARVEGRIHAPPMPLPPREQWGGDLAYSRVRVAGVFVPHAETLVQAVTERGGGWWVIAPFRTAEGIVLVNRGFVPDRRAPAQIGSRTIVTGLVRTSEPGGGFLRSNDPVAGRWYSRDVAAIARARRIGPVAPFFVDADATPNPGGYPIGGLTVVAFRNTHLGYALTWFALAGLLIGGAVVLMRERR